MLLCYGYAVLVIVFSGRLTGTLQASQRASRKFLHAMIGNLVFAVPFFTSNVYPTLVAAPFVLLTFLASPYSPVKDRLGGLANITEEGHPLGLVFYAISFTLLAFLFASRPAVVAAGILPMAYGDSAASLMGEKLGERRHNLIYGKSLEGSSAMFAASFLSLGIAFLCLSALYSFPVIQTIIALFSVVGTVTVVELLSPKGFDDLTVPILGAMIYWAMTGGI